MFIVILGSILVCLGLSRLSFWLFKIIVPLANSICPWRQPCDHAVVSLQRVNESCLVLWAVLLEDSLVWKHRVFVTAFHPLASFLLPGIHGQGQKTGGTGTKSIFALFLVSDMLRLKKKNSPFLLPRFLYLFEYCDSAKAYLKPRIQGH